MAERLGCTQSRVSKLEHSDTSRISVRDLEDYSRNLGINLIIRFQERTGETSFEILGPEETEEELGLAKLSQ